MAEFIRPEVTEALFRWRGEIGAVAVGLFGGWLGLAAFGTLALLGWALLALSPVLLLIAVQRRRFAAAGGEGPGVVELVEGRIGYFGPAGGGFVVLDDLTEIRLVPHGGGRAWLLRASGSPDLVVPLGAQGDEALFDAFVTLPGLTAAQLVSAVTEEAGRSNVTALIWRRPAPAT